MLIWVMIIMTLSNAVKTRINQLLKAKNMNVNMLATSAGINPATIRSILKDRCKVPNSQTIYYICIGFDISLKDFYDCDLFNFNNIDD